MKHKKIECRECGGPLDICSGYCVCGCDDDDGQRTYVDEDCLTFKPKSRFHRGGHCLKSGTP
jgi:hypothetical protein